MSQSLVDNDPSLNRSPVFEEEDTNLPVREGTDYLYVPSSLSEMNRTAPKKGWDRLMQRLGIDENSTPVSSDDWQLSWARQTLTDYIMVRLPHRASDGEMYTYRFLVNPASVEVSYNTLDAQSLTRNGWVFGVWGDDLVQISMSGKTAGYYFANGLTEANRMHSQSYRNLIQLQKVFENNGYWFEGEGESGTLPRKRIQYHEDVQLIYNNFIWYGMFESLTVSSDAEQPYVDQFKLSFVAWKERFRKTSPWRDSLHNDVRRGHTRGVWNAYGKHEGSQESQDQARANEALLARGEGPLREAPQVQAPFAPPAFNPGAMLTNPNLGVFTSQPLFGGSR